MLLGELNYLETFGYLEVQAVKLVYPAEERLLLGLDGEDTGSRVMVLLPRPSSMVLEIEKLT